MLELYQEYKRLNKAIQQLSPNQKQELVGLTLKPEWASFLQMLENWKHMIVQKGFTLGKSGDDLLSIQSQIKTISALKTFQNKYKHLHKDKQELGEDDPATTVPL